MFQKIVIFQTDKKLTGNYFEKLKFHVSLQIMSKDSQVKTQIVLWIFILFKVTR